MVLLGELFKHYAEFEVDKLYRIAAAGSTYKPHKYFVVAASNVFGMSHRIDIYTKNKTCIYFMFVAASSASRKELDEKAKNLLTMLKAAQ